MQEAVLKAYAKINLALYVGDRRPDGYHDISSVMQCINLYDTVKIKKNNTGEINCKTDCAELLNDDTNIAVKAAKLIKEECALSCGFDIFINKRIPLGGGMAGGSTDAAAVLSGVNSVCNLKKTKAELMELGKKLGADVPFCIFKQTALAGGIGEKIVPVFCPCNYYVAVVNPNINVSTGKIFNMMDEEKRSIKKCDKIIDALKSGCFKEICKLLDNDMQKYTARNHPEIEEIVKKLKEAGAENAIMSGSGSTCFGLFEKKPQEETLYGIFPNYFVHIAKPVFQNGKK